MTEAKDLYPDTSLFVLIRPWGTQQFLNDLISLFRSDSFSQWNFETGHSYLNANDINPSWLSEIYFWFSINAISYGPYEIKHIYWSLVQPDWLNRSMLVNLAYYDRKPSNGLL